MRVLHTLAFLGPDKGGPSISVPALLRAAVRCGVEVELVTQEWPGEALAALPAEPYERAWAPVADRSGFGFSPALRRLVRERAARADAVHSHNLWMYVNRVSASTAAELRKPHLVSPRGALEPWALRRSRWRKRVASALFQGGALRNAACIHALTVPEARNVKSLLPAARVAVVPNGVEVAAFSRLPPPWAFGERFPEVAGKRVALFMARLHPKKGAHHLIQAWSRVARDHPGWQLVLAGPDEVGRRGELERTAAALGVGERVTFTGLLAGEAKLEALAAAGVFLLPSFSEGFSMGVLEAMACGVPVLLTPGCNFPRAREAGAAVEVPPTAEGTEAGLRALLERSDAERAEIGARARRLVEAEYGWEGVARRMHDVYRWCVGGGDPPEAFAWE